MKYKSGSWRDIQRSLKSQVQIFQLNQSEIQITVLSMICKTTGRKRSNTLKSTIYHTCCLNSLKQDLFLISGISLKTPNFILGMYLDTSITKA